MVRFQMVQGAKAKVVKKIGDKLDKRLAFQHHNLSNRHVWSPLDVRKFVSRIQQGIVRTI